MTQVRSCSKQGSPSREQPKLDCTGPSCRVKSMPVANTLVPGPLAFLLPITFHIRTQLQPRPGGPLCPTCCWQSLSAILDTCQEWYQKGTSKYQQYIRTVLLVGYDHPFTFKRVCRDTPRQPHYCKISHVHFNMEPLLHVHIPEDCAIACLWVKESC